MSVGASDGGAGSVAVARNEDVGGEERRALAKRREEKRECRLGFHRRRIFVLPETKRKLGHGERLNHGHGAYTIPYYHIFLTRVIGAIGYHCT